MIIKHLKSYPIFYDWIGKNGWELSFNQEIEIPDEYALLTKFRDAHAEGHFEIIEFEEDDLDIVIQKELKDAPATGGDKFQPDKFNVTVFGQTHFVLSKVPNNVNKVICIVSGLVQEPIEDYYVTGQTLIWKDRHFQLDTTDWLEAIYPV